MFLQRKSNLLEDAEIGISKVDAGYLGHVSWLGTHGQVVLMATLGSRGELGAHRVSWLISLSQLEGHALAMPDVDAGYLGHVSWLGTHGQVVLMATLGSRGGLGAHRVSWLISLSQLEGHILAMPDVNAGYLGHVSWSGTHGQVVLMATLGM